MGMIDAVKIMRDAELKAESNKITLGEYEAMIRPLRQVMTKADYETRLKADLVAMLTELQLEIEEIKPLEPTDDEDWQYGCFHGLELMQDKCLKLIQQKIDKLKEGADGENNN